MIEVKNLCKTYNVKGNITKALDDVSIKFPETGMVFLLGKSGSGKSTLLNIIGGLDKADSGEIIIMGRSSSTFSKSDFDSYRNTYVGFVFQEYNILNEFSIEDNLSLALELQGKKKNKEMVKDLLEQVDLEGFAKRKPMTLSGGQKQRIAIARALIKDPKIIMADEPTGALDSKTGKQVFETLKKLSLDHLVIVVSHDREFSEIYGDRIIELKDGKILSDETKEKIESKKINENISLVSDSTLSISDSKKLNSDDITKIVEFINNSDGELLISKGADDITSFKKANHIDDENKTEKFLETKQESIKTKEYTKDDTKFIKSKLPLSKASKMGISSLKVKPFRLILTMLLTIISFVLFGVASALMNFNAEKVTKNSFENSEYQELAIENNYNVNYEYYDNGKLSSKYSSTSSTLFTQAEVDKLTQDYGVDVLPVIATSYGRSKMSVSNVITTSDTPKTMTDTSCYGFAIANDNSKYKNDLIGTYPKDETEIAISIYYAKVILKSKLTDLTTGQEIAVSNYNDLIGKKLKISINGYDVIFSISAIFTTPELPEKYNNYDLNQLSDDWNNDKISAFNKYLTDTTYKIFLVNKVFYSYYQKHSYNSLPMVYDYNKYFNNGNSTKISIDSTDEYSGRYISGYKDINEANLPIRKINDTSTNNIVVPIEVMYGLIGNKVYEVFDKEIWQSEDLNKIYYLYDKYFRLYRNQEIIEADKNHTDEEKQEFHNKYDHYREIETEVMINDFKDDQSPEALELKSDPDYIKYQSDYDYQTYFNNIRYENISKYSNAYNMIVSIYYYGSFNFNFEFYNYIEKDDMNKIYDLFDSILKAYFSNLNASLEISTNSDNKTVINRTISGYYTIDDAKNYNYGIYINSSDEAYFKPSNYQTSSTKYNLEESDIYYIATYIPIKGANSNNNIFAEVNKIKDNDSIYKIDNTLYSRVYMIVDLITNLKQIFFYIGLVLAIFSAMLLFNFISVSISSKTHEIGVLRAVGARGNDVFKIFFSESLFIALLSFIIALIGAFIIVVFLNKYITDTLGMSLKLLTFGPLSIILMLGIAIVVAILGTFIPVFIISRKKPVDSLRSL